MHIFINLRTIIGQCQLPWELFSKPMLLRQEGLGSLSRFLPSLQVELKWNISI